MVKVIGFPLQLFALGVTVTVDTIGVLPVFKVVNGAILPVPLAPNPIEVLEFVQLYCVPDTNGLLAKFIAFVREPAHFT